jgi:hypothetical protein
MIPMMDAQAAYGFLVPQLTSIESTVYRIKYPGIRYPELIPVDTTGNPWTPSVTYFSVDGVGRAGWFNGRAMDIPNTELVRNRYQTGVEMAGIGYEYDTEELEQARLLNINVTDEKASYARLAAEQFVDQTALYGDSTKGFIGLFNNPSVAVMTAAAVGGQNGATNSTLWANKTADQILADVNAVLGSIYGASATVELADTVLLPVSSYTYAANTRLDSISQTTILEWLKQNNTYTAETGRPLMIRQVRGLGMAGAGGTGRLIAYRRDPTVLKLHMPMPWRQINDPWRKGPMLWHIPGIMRFGGVDIRLPGAVRYMDGLSSGDTL